MAWPSDGNFASWPKRKEITVPAASVVGTGALTDFPLYVKDLADDADILASAHPTGKDIVFTSSDGETQLPHELIPEGQWVNRNAAYIWFNRHQAWRDSVSGKTWFGTVAPNKASVSELIHSTGITTTYAYTSETNADDHNQPSTIKRTFDDKLMSSWSKHTGTSEIRWAISTNAADASAWGTEQTMQPNGAVNYSYPGLIEIPDASEIWCIYRTNSVDWAYVATDNGATTSFGSQQKIWNSGVTSPYLQFVANGTNRIDFIVTERNPNSGADNEIYHFYALYSGGSWSWHATDGTSLGTIPAAGWSPSDLTAVVDPGATSNAWIEDIFINASGNPAFLYAFFPTNADPTDQELWIAEWSGAAWATTKIIDTWGGGPIPSAEPFYTGGACFMPGDTTKVYAGVQVSGTYEMQLWENSAGTWSKTDDITSGSTGHQFRPMRVTNATESDKAHVMWMSGSYTDFSDYATGVRMYPAGGSYFSAANVKATVDGTTDTTIYCYYGNTSNVAKQWDRANVFNSDYKLVLRLQEPLDVAEPYNAPNALGTGTLLYEAEDVEATPHVHSATGEAWNLLTASDNIDITSPPNLAGATALTVQVWANSTVKTGSNEYVLASNWENVSAANFLFRLDPAGNNVDFFIVKEADTQFGGSAALTWSASTWYRWSGVWSAAAGMLIRRDKTEASVSATTGGALDATASPTIRLGEMPNGSDDYTGYENELRIATAALSKDWTDTEYDAWVTGIVTFGDEESDAGSDDLTPTDLATGAPTVSAPAIGQTHALTATDLATGAPTLSSPALGEPADTDALTAADLLAGMPVLDTPALGQVHALTATDLITGVPTLVERVPATRGPSLVAWALLRRRL